MDDDALAPVIAMMLILAISVTLFSVYTSTYLPALKEQAEVDHLHQVETGFTKFSSEIENTLTFVKMSDNPNISFSEQIPLGGGDILLNSMKSAGTIRIWNESQGSFTIRNNKTNEIIAKVPLILVSYTYEPDNNFWINQTYTWHEGIVNVTKGIRATPLQLNSAADRNRFGLLVTPFRSINSTGNVTMRIVTLVAWNPRIASGNGIARLKLETRDVTDPSLIFVPDANITWEPTGDLFPAGKTEYISNVTFRITEVRIWVE